MRGTLLWLRIFTWIHILRKHRKDTCKNTKQCYKNSFLQAHSMRHEILMSNVWRLVRRFVWTYRYSIHLVGWGGAEGGVSLVVAGSKARLGLGEEGTVLRWRGIWEVVHVLWVSVSGGWTWGWCFPRGYVGFCGKGRNVLLVLKLLQGSQACSGAGLAWLLVRGGAAWPVKQP